jgi:superfamily II DNA/RNA helicase
LEESLSLNNYKYTTEIQRLALEKGILEGQNMLLNAENGSGKTLAYLLPILNQLYIHKDEAT